ncbi:MAG: hypothetical protein RLZZ399_403 [Verrucomicrobiota bacterium]|jgi:hypothetical protein
MMPRRSWISPLSALAALLPLLPTLPLPARALEPVQFNRDIRPILSEHCFACHGFDPKQRDSGLRLDRREDALQPAKSGSVAIVPGNPEASELVQRILATDTTELMPPPKAHKPLKPSQKELLKRWIAEGAPYEAHWAYTPLQKPKGFEEVESAIDPLIGRALASRGITPSPRADPATLLRRLCLDLTGLPPTPEEVRAFTQASEQDQAAAFEKALHDQVASKHFGERWAIWWLDAVRFADTVGYHGDQTQRVFPYRDYVIEAFQSNKRFDVFTLEQIAGDLLPEATPEQRVASGFNRLSMMTREGGIQPKEYLAKYMADRVRAVGSTWLGSTIGCSQCHDHKFDPITQRDFYTLGAFFADIKQYALYHGVFLPNPELKGWTDHHPFPPEVEVPNRYREERRQRFAAQMQQIAREAWDLTPPQVRESWLASVQTFLESHPNGWHTPAPEAETFQKGKPVPDSARVESDQSIVFGKNAGPQIRVRIRPGALTLAAICTELLPRPEFGGNLFRSGDTGSLRILPRLHLHQAGNSKPIPLTFRHADAARKDPAYFQGETLVGTLQGWRPSSQCPQERQQAVWLLAQPILLSEEDTLELVFSEAKLAPASMRIRISPLSALHDAASPFPLESLNHPALWLTSTPTAPAAKSAFVEAEKRFLDCHDGRAHSLVSQSVPPYEVRILPRGNWQDESGEVVRPQTLSFLPALPASSDAPLNRLDLARWLTSRENPLTPRAVMNRLWKQFFGTGLSAVLDDLGAQGEPPSHPELLDWLAAEFRDSGWDFQHMIRLIVRSQAYQRSSRRRTELGDVDPANRLLASQNPRRLEAELVRDNALAVAGLLNRDIGGPSSHVYFPDNLYRDMEFPRRSYAPEKDERQWRRGLYMHWQRTFLHPMLANFDAPNRDESACMRTQANTPQQALTLLNDPTFVEAARALAQQVLQSSAASDSSRLAHAFERTLARLPSPEEQSGLLLLLQGHRQHFSQSPEDTTRFLQIGILPNPPQLAAPELAAWTSVCRTLLNLHETITRY